MKETVRCFAERKKLYPDNKKVMKINHINPGNPLHKE